MTPNMRWKFALLCGSEDGTAGLSPDEKLKLAMKYLDEEAEEVDDEEAEKEDAEAGEEEEEEGEEEEEEENE